MRRRLSAGATQTRNSCPKWKEEVPRCRKPSRHVSDTSWLQACLVLGVDGDQLPSSQGWFPPPRGVVFFQWGDSEPGPHPWHIWGTREPGTGPHPSQSLASVPRDHTPAQSVLFPPEALSLMLSSIPSLGVRRVRSAGHRGQPGLWRVCVWEGSQEPWSSPPLPL